jgi:hypothetical protein
VTSADETVAVANSTTLSAGRHFVMARIVYRCAP